MIASGARVAPLYPMDFLRSVCRGVSILQTLGVRPLSILSLSLALCPPPAIESGERCKLPQLVPVRAEPVLW